VCTTLVVGRTRSATGHVLLAHSEELGRNSAHRVCVVDARETAPGERFPLHSGGSLEQAGRIARHVCTKIFDKRHYPGEHTSGINEHGVAVANNMAMKKGVPESDMYDVVPGGLIWTEFLQIVLERATSAREGVAMVSALAERHGLSCDSGTMIAIADPEEAWWVEIARGGHSAAERVADDEVSVRANCYRIAGFAREFGDPANQADRYNLDRHDALEARVSGMAEVGPADLMALLRDVYEGTPLFLPRPDGSPFRTKRRTVARMNTEACTVLEPRRTTLPPPLAHVMWCCLSTSLTGVFVPFHVGITSVEAHYGTAGARYDPASAYWLFTELAKLVDWRYRASAELVVSTWREFEAETFRALGSVESRCGGLDLAESVAAITQYDLTRAAEAVGRLGDMLAEVKTRAFHEDF
jgi:dipeptidase